MWLVCALIFLLPVFLKQDIDLVPGPWLSQEGLRGGTAKGTFAWVTAFITHMNGQAHAVLRTRTYAAVTQRARAGNEHSRNGCPDTRLTIR